MRKYISKEEEPMIYTTAYECGPLLKESERQDDEADVISGYLE